MIYTSYFGNISKVLASVPDASFVSIAGKTPEWFAGKKFKPLMPHYGWWREWHEKFADDLGSIESRAWYTTKYMKTVLSSLEPLNVARQLKDLASWKPTFILCYETPEKFCHRHIVAKWLSDARIECEEWEARS